MLKCKLHRIIWIYKYNVRFDVNPNIPIDIDVWMVDTGLHFVWHLFVASVLMMNVLVYFCVDWITLEIILKIVLTNFDVSCDMRALFF